MAGCMEATWVLSFDKQNMKEIIKYEELLDFAFEAAHDSSQPYICRHSAAGLLFQLREELAKSDKYCALSMCKTKIFVSC